MTSQPEHPHLRASDRDRDVVVENLQAAFGDGRLDRFELDARLQRALAARTIAELTPLTADLPGSTGPGSARSPHRRPTPERRRRAAQQATGAAWATWAVAVVINLLIWALVSLAAGEAVYFWPLWVAGPWGAVLIAGTFGARAARLGCPARSA